MSFDHQHYVPCLRWKMGEYQAILHLFDETKDLITPLIEVPEIGFDFASQIENQTIDEHLAKFAKQIKEKWGTNRCFVDIHLLNPNERMKDKRHPLKFVFDELRDKKCNAVPVTGINSDVTCGAIIKDITSTDKYGLCVRLSIEEASKPELKNSIQTILRTNNLNADQCDLILDLRAPNFEPIDGFAKLCIAIIKCLPQLRQWRSFALCGTSFPKTMHGIPQGQTLLKRSEWLLYKRILKFISAEGVRLPTFSDYGISHPDVSSIDMRLVKPSAQIRYTAENSWLIVKGTNVRDNGFSQYRELCRSVIKSPHYLNKTASFGDKYIAGCADGIEKTGSLTTWRMIGTNHHIEKVVNDIASLFDSEGNP